MHRTGVLALPFIALVQTSAVSGAIAQSPVSITYTPIAPAPSNGSALPVQPPPTVPAASPPVAEQPTPPNRSWYGSQVLLADGLTFGLGLAVARAGSPDSGLLVLGAGWVLGAPLVHLVHHRHTTALTSLALRAGLVLGGYVAGGPCQTTCTTAAGACEQDPNASDHWQSITTSCGGLMALFLGSMVASAVDSASLAWEEARPVPPAPSPPQATASIDHRIRIDSAGVFPLQAGAGLSLGGRF